MNVDGKKPGDALISERDTLVNDVKKAEARLEVCQKELAQALDKNKTLEHENHCLRVKVEQYRGKEEAFEFSFDKLGDR